MHWTKMFIEHILYYVKCYHWDGSQHLGFLSAAIVAPCCYGMCDESLNIVWRGSECWINFFWTEGKHSELRQVDRIVIHWLLKFYSAIEEHVSILTNVVIQINIEANFPTLNQAWNNTEAMSFVVLVGLGAPFKSVPLTDRWCDGSALCKWWRPCPLKDEIPAKINGHHDSYRDQSALLRANTPTK